MNIQRRPKKTMGDHRCTYCYRTYKKKENYDKHLQCCEFFYRSRNTTTDESTYEPLPSQRELFQLVKELAYKCEKMQKTIDNLTSNSLTKQRKQITDYLQYRSPQTTAIEWSRNISITQKHLDAVFEGSIIDGMVSAIKDNIHIASLLPFCSFEQKPNTIYIYSTIAEETIPKWHQMTMDEVDKIISILSYKFLQAFIQWQKKTAIPKPTYDDDDDDEDDEDAERQMKVEEEIKNQHMLYMIKINGTRTTDEKKRASIKKTLYSLTQYQLPTSTTP